MHDFSTVLNRVLRSPIEDAGGSETGGGELGSDVLHAGGRGESVGGPALRGGELNAAITSALVGIHTSYLGRGPKRASTFHHGSVLVTLMYDVLTHAEKSLTKGDQLDAVSGIRHLFQKTMETDFRAAVERLTQRRVVAFISGNEIEPDVAAEIFVLDRPL